MISRFFLARPVFTGVIAIIIVLAGLVAFAVLPVAEYPEIAPPSLQISTNYPGASADTVARTVAAPIEEQLSGVPNLTYFTSSSASNGQLSIAATFEVGTNIDEAMFDVNNRVQQALPRLPEEVRRNGVLVQKRATDVLAFIALFSPKGTHSAIELSNYAAINIVEELKRIPGMGDVQIFGARDYSMRIWLHPDKMSQLGVTTTDVANAIRAQNAQYAAGKIGGEPAPPGQSIVYTVTAAGRLIDPEEFGNIIVRAAGPAGVLRIRDIARVELGAQTYESLAMMNGKPVTIMPLYLQTGANALAVGQAFLQRMEELKKQFPADMEYTVPIDQTIVIRASLSEVTQTILIAALLVIAVVFLFLQSWRATLIPILVVPISLIGTFAGLWLLGFSINTLTLFGMVLAVGIVVDDAIVVLENVERLMREEKLDPFSATLEAMREVSGAVIAIVIVLCAVFVPVAFLGGLAGQLYRQFAVTVAIAVVLSGFAALTITPVLCSLLLKDAEHHARIFGPFNRAVEWTIARFMDTVRYTLNRPLLSGAAVVAVIGLAGLLFWRVPHGFIPTEDLGYFNIILQLPDTAALERTERATEHLRREIKDNPALRHLVAINGLDFIGGGTRGSSATMFVRLKEWEDRDKSLTDIIADVNEAAGAMREGRIIVIQRSAIRGLGLTSGFEFFVQSRGEANVERLGQVTQNFIAELSKHPDLAGADTFARSSVAQLQIDVEREKALALGVPINDIFDALSSTIGALYVNDFNKFGRTYRVQLQADATFRDDPADLGNIYVRSATTGEMIPVKAFLTIKNTLGPEQIERFNGFMASRVIGQGKPHVSSGAAMDAVEEVATRTLPAGYRIAWSGQSFEERKASTSSSIAFAFGIVMVFLILAALYERWRLPIAVILAVPFAVLGALGIVWLMGMQNDIYFQVGLVVLIGLAAKNAILIVEFAQQGYLAGKSAREAALDAARLRFRPIVMTSLAFVFGVMPLVFATGAGAAARRSMGTGVVGGMLVATFVAPIFVPLFFSWVARRRAVRREAAGAQSTEVVTPES